MEYHLAKKKKKKKKRNEVLTHATTRMNLETIMLSEKNPVIKDHISVKCPE